MANVETIEEKRRVFEAFSRALVRESHNLMQRPDLLWQQLYNRLHWEEEQVPAVLQPEYGRRTAPGAAPWLRTRTPFRESEALIRTLQGHTLWVNGCAVSPDGSFIVSASLDNTLKVWDAATGTERASIAFLGGLRCVALHARHPLAAAGDEGGNVYIMDMALEYGLAIVTAVDLGQGYVLRCPGCSKLIPFKENWLGQEITCPQEGCGTRMKVNPFVVGGNRSPAPKTKREPVAGKSKAKLPSPKPMSPAPEKPLTLPELVKETGLRHVDLSGGGTAFLFEGARTDPVTVQVRELRGGICFLVVPLPEPGFFGKGAALENMLRTSYAANYVKALLLESGKPALAAELPVSTLTPDILEGLLRGLAYLGDVRSKDLSDWKGWQKRLRECASAQAALDVDQVRGELEAMLKSAGLAPQRMEKGWYVIQFRIEGYNLDVVIRPGRSVISFIVYLGGTKPRGNKTKYLGCLLELNRKTNVAKAGIDSDGDVALLYEVPGLFPGLLDQVKARISLLFLGIVALHKRS